MSSGNRLTSLDGLRGVAAMHIMLSHAYLGVATFHEYTTPFAILTWPIRNGFKYVPLLLVLSGFVLTHSKLSRMRSGREETYAAYLKMRWLRIGLPYYVAVLVYMCVLALCWMIGKSHPRLHELSFYQLATHLAFVHGFMPDTLYGINEHLWTLSVIFQFYLVFPLMFLAAKTMGVAWFLGLLIVTSALWNCVFFWDDRYQYLCYGLLPGRWSNFGLGIALGLWYNALDDGLKGRRFVTAAVSFAVFLLVVGWIVHHPLQGPCASILYAGGYTLIMAAALVSTRHGGSLARWTSHPILVRLGAMSYSIYLIHYLPLLTFLAVLRRVLPSGSLAADLFVVLVVPGIMLVTGWAFYRLVEAPINDWLKQGSPAKRAGSLSDVLARWARPGATSPPMATIEKF